MVDCTTDCIRNSDGCPASGACPGGNSDQILKSVDLSPGQIFKHKSDKYEMLLMLSGSVVLNSERWPDLNISERQLSLLPPGDIYTLRGVEHSRFIMCRLIEDVKYCKKIEATQFNPRASRRDSSLHVLPFKLPITRFTENLTIDVYNTLCCRPYLVCKFTELMFLLRTCYSQSELTDLFYPLIRKNTDFQAKILRIQGEVKTAKEMADRCYMTEVGFRKRFKQEMGIPPKEFLIRRKKQRLIQDLRSGVKSNYELCEEYGFSSPSGFTNFCRKHLGGTPSDLRRVAGNF